MERDINFLLLVCTCDLQFTIDFFQLLNNKKLGMKYLRKHEIKENEFINFNPKKHIK